VGFVPAAWLVGYLTERGETKLWQRWLAGIAGVLVIYVCGLPILKLTTGADWGTAWGWGIAPFIVVDLAKVAIAASLAEGWRSTLLHYLPPKQ
jgi:biotin transport system substrate-specific component